MWKEITVLIIAFSTCFTICIHFSTGNCCVAREAVASPCTGGVICPGGCPTLSGSVVSRWYQV